MKNALILSLFVMLVVSCQETNNISSEFPQNSEIEIDERAPGVIPSNIGLNSIILNHKDYTWQDLDIFYRSEVILSYSKFDYSDNLKLLTIWHLINTFNLIDNADIEVIEFYTQELSDLPYINDPDIFVRLLDRLKESKTNKEVAKLAKKRYHNNLGYIDKNFDKVDFFAENGEQTTKLIRLMKYAASLK